MKLFTVHDIYKVHDNFRDETSYMTQKEIEDYANHLANKIMEEDENGQRPLTNTFIDCVMVLESANCYVCE